MNNDALLNDLIGSRICHDLVNPLSAIGNGVELLSMSGTGDSPELTLISESVGSATARIRFFRIAFGSSTPGSRIGNSELRSVLQDMFRCSRIQIDWQVTTDLPRTEAKLASLLILCLESALAWGGTISIQRDDNERWALNATGERHKYDDALWQQLSGADDDPLVTSSDVHFALCHGTAARLDRAIVVQKSSHAIQISF